MFQLTFKFRSHFICELHIHKNRWNHCSAKHFYTKHLDAVDLAGNSKQNVHRVFCPPGLHLWRGGQQSRWVFGSL